jgi:phage-related baseplate assembly protein
MAPPSPWQRRLALLANRTNPAWERWNVRQGRLGRDVRQSTLDYAVAQAG